MLHVSTCAHRPGAAARVAHTLVALLICIAAPGCSREGIEEHRVSKGVERTPEAVPDAAQSVVPASQPDISDFPVPSQWRLDPEPRPMRIATYVVPDVDGDVEVALTSFPGHVGGELANLNRWRSQMGLEPLDAQGLEGTIVRFDSPATGYEARIEGVDRVMLAAGVYDAAHDRTWFVRAVMTHAAADRIAPELFKFARTMLTPVAEEEE